METNTTADTNATATAETNTATLPVAAPVITGMPAGATVEPKLDGFPYSDLPPVKNAFSDTWHIPFTSDAPKNGPAGHPFVRAHKMGIGYYTEAGIRKGATPGAARLDTSWQLSAKPFANWKKPVVPKQKDGETPEQTKVRQDAEDDYIIWQYGAELNAFIPGEKGTTKTRTAAELSEMAKKAGITDFEAFSVFADENRTYTVDSTEDVEGTVESLVNDKKDALWVDVRRINAFMDAKKERLMQAVRNRALKA